MNKRLNFEINCAKCRQSVSQYPCNIFVTRHLVGIVGRFLIAMVALVGAVPVPVGASDRLNQFQVLENRNAPSFSVSIDAPPVFIPPPPGEAPQGFTYQGPHMEVAQRAAAEYSIPQDLFLRLIEQESGWNPRAISNKGAIGLTQLMPDIARVLGVDPYDPKQNIYGGARYLAQQYQTFRIWRLALAAYNAGPGAVQKYGGVPPFEETQNYVRAILR